MLSALNTVGSKSGTDFDLRGEFDECPGFNLLCKVLRPERLQRLPEQNRTACRERTMQGLTCEVERLQRMVVKQSVEMTDALRDLFTVCETPDPAIRLRKAEKWRQWMMNEGNGRK